MSFKFSRAIVLSLFFICSFCLKGFAISNAKVEISPAYVHLDVLESGKTVQKMDIWGARLDGWYRVYEGLCFKPSVFYGCGDGKLFVGGLGVGYGFCLNPQLHVMPYFGWQYNEIHTKIKLPIRVYDGFGGDFYYLDNVKERFRSNSPYIALDLCYSINLEMRLYGTVQYSWSHTSTKLTLKDPIDLVLSDTKSRTQGFSFAGAFEYDLWGCLKGWSANVGGGYNNSLSKEKHGIRGYAIKLGLARWL